MQTASSSNQPKVLYTNPLAFINNSEISCQSFSIGSMVSGQFCFSANSKSEGGPVNQREGQIITEYLAVLVESRIECETTHTSTDILTEKGLTP